MGVSLRFRTAGDYSYCQEKSTRMSLHADSLRGEVHMVASTSSKVELQSRSIARELTNSSGRRNSARSSEFGLSL